MRAHEERMRRTVVAVRAQFPYLGLEQNVERVVRFVLAAWQKRKPRERPGREDDARDIQNWSIYLAPLSARDLREVISLKPSEVRRRMQGVCQPFNKLDRKQFEFLCTLSSGRLIGKIAQCRLDTILETGRCTPLVRQ